MDGRIFHITEPSLWERAVADGVYTGSTRDATLADVGYVHCSFRHQVEPVANYVYADFDGPLVLLEVDTEGVGAEMRVENLDGGTEGFPHIYGALPTAAVTAVRQLDKQGSRWALPAEI
jgi:uncharacterized protein (DUF952 family)